MFAIGDVKWPGISKLIEEAGEVMQVCGKLIQVKGLPRHWSSPNLIRLLEEELGDLQAAILFVTEHCGLDKDFIEKRTQMKLERFNRWNKGENDPIPGNT